MNRMKFFVIALFVCILLLLALFLSMVFLQKTTVTKTPSPTVAPDKEVTISIFPSSTSFEIGKPAQLHIKVKGNDLVISAIAVRIMYRSEKELLLEPQAATMTVNPTLLGNGWVSPINT